MVDKEVVDILAEIKQRVVSAKIPEPPTQAPTNGISSTHPELPATLNHDFASLAVLARAWDRLPPLVTNRTGAAAKLDLWFKAKMRTAFRWFTWEQINFNAATHQTMKELIETLAAQQQHLSSLQNQLISFEQQFHQKLAEEFQQKVDDLEHRLSAAKVQNEQVLNSHESNFGVMRALQASQHADVNAKFDTLAGQYSTDLNEVRKSVESRDKEHLERLAEIVRELRENHEKILDEHRVSFKQLSLELSEAQVLQDRARRELDSRVTKLER